MGVPYVVQHMPSMPHVHLLCTQGLYWNMRAFSWPPGSTGWRCQESRLLPMVNGGVTMRQVLQSLRAPSVRQSPVVHSSNLKNALYINFVYVLILVPNSPLSTSKWTTWTQIFISVSACGEPCLGHMDFLMIYSPTHNVVPHCTGSIKHCRTLGASHLTPKLLHTNLSIQTCPWLLGHLSWILITSLDFLLFWSNYLFLGTLVLFATTFISSHRSHWILGIMTGVSVTSFPKGSRILCTCQFLSLMTSHFAKHEFEEGKPWLAYIRVSYTFTRGPRLLCHPYIAQESKPLRQPWWSR